MHLVRKRKWMQFTEKDINPQNSELKTLCYYYTKVITFITETSTFDSVPRDLFLITNINARGFK